MGLQRIIRRHRDDLGRIYDEEILEDNFSYPLPSGGYVTRAFLGSNSGTIPFDDVITPRTVFAKSYVRCEWCGVKNKEDAPYCVGCGGPL